MSKKEPNKVTIHPEVTGKAGDKYRLKETGEILTYVNESNKQFQKEYKHVFENKNNELLEYTMNVVEKIK